MHALRPSFTNFTNFAKHWLARRILSRFSLLSYHFDYTLWLNCSQTHYFLKQLRFRDIFTCSLHNSPRQQKINFWHKFAFSRFNNLAKQTGILASRASCTGICRLRWDFWAGRRRIEDWGLEGGKDLTRIRTFRPFRRLRLKTAVDLPETRPTEASLEDSF